MHPGFFGWWKQGCGSSAHGHGPFQHAGHGGGGCGRGHGHRGHGSHEGEARASHDEGGGEGGGFGVRRPLRFLAWKLELEEEQVAKLASIIEELKTERAQSAVDHRRTVAAFADAIEGASFDETKAKEAGDSRVRTAERLRDAVTKALGRIHGILDGEQRKRLGYLLRTGALGI